MRREERKPSEQMATEQPGHVLDRIGPIHNWYMTATMYSLNSEPSFGMPILDRKWVWDVEVASVFSALYSVISCALVCFNRMFEANLESKPAYTNPLPTCEMIHASMSDHQLDWPPSLVISQSTYCGRIHKNSLRLVGTRQPGP